MKDCQWASWVRQRAAGGGRACGVRWETPRDQAPAWSRTCLRSSASSTVTRSSADLAKAASREAGASGDKCAPQQELGHEGTSGQMRELVECASALALWEGGRRWRGAGRRGRAHSASGGAPPHSKTLSRRSGLQRVAGPAAALSRRATSRPAAHRQRAARLCGLRRGAAADGASGTIPTAAGPGSR